MNVPLASAMQRLLAAMLCFWFIGLGTGCDNAEPVPADRVQIVSGDNQANLPEEFLDEPIVIRVLGPRHYDLLGRRRDREPAAGIAVTFEVTEELAATEGPGVEPRLHRDRSPGVEGASVLKVMTDATGIARAEVKLGRGTGVWIVEADIQESRGQRVRLYVTSGLRKLQSHHEAVVGSEVALELELAASDPDPESESESDADEGSKAKNAEARWQIVYRIIDEPPGSEDASLKNPRETTRLDNTGDEALLRQKAPTVLELGDAPGIYTVVADLVPLGTTAATRQARPYRGIVFRIAAMDWRFIMLGGAAAMLLFVLGVRFVGRGALLLTSLRLQLVTTSAGRNRFVSYAVGAFDALRCQSSSLVSSHLASLANGGLVTARDSIGILAGAALGATALPLLLALEPGSLAAPVLACGAILFFYGRRTNIAAWALVCVGAGLILVGWNLLQEVAALASLSETLKRDVLAPDPQSTGPLTYGLAFLSHFTFAAAAGFLLRSGNLPAVIAMILSVAAVISPVTAVPLVLGGNLGASVMVLVTTLRKRREARRLALMGSLLQVAACIPGVTLALVVVGGEPLYLWIVEWLTPGRLFPLGNNVGLHIAVLHTVHNLLAGLLVMAFPGLTSRLLDRIMPPLTLDQAKPHQLDHQLVSVPDLALQQATAEVIYLNEVGRKTVAEAFDAFRYQDLELAEQVVRRAETMTTIYRDVSLFLLEVSENQLQRAAAAQVEVLQSAAESQVRIAELAERLRDLAGRKVEDQVSATEEVERDLNEAYDLVVAQFGNILSLLKEPDSRTEENAAKMVERLAKFSTRVESHWGQRIHETESSGTSVDLHLHALIYREAFELLFRIAAHLAHVAQRMRLFRTDRGRGF